MIRRTRRLAGLLVGIAVCVTLALFPGVSFGADVVYLKDGTRLEGSIERETDSAIFLVISIGEIKHNRLIRLSDIDRIERDAASAPEAALETRGIDPDIGASGATKVCFITLEDTVGAYFNKDAIEHSVELIEDEDPDIIVFWVDSGGGSIELARIQEYINEEVKPKYRTVAWIRSAISAAAMAVWPVNEMYMMREGNIGACTGFSGGPGGAKAMGGDSLEEVLVLMEKMSIAGGRDPLIMRAMQVYMTLSCDLDKDGAVTWHEGDQGQFLVSPQHEILTLNALDATRFGVARAIADTKDELAKAMGLVEWVEVGKKADEYQHQFRANVKAAEVELGELWSKLNIALDFAGSAPSEKERDRQIGIARRYLKEMKGWINRAPSLAEELGLTPEWFRETDERLKQLAAGAR